MSDPNRRGSTHSFRTNQRDTIFLPMLWNWVSDLENTLLSILLFEGLTNFGNAPIAKNLSLLSDARFTSIFFDK